MFIEPSVTLLQDLGEDNRMHFLEGVDGASDLEGTNGPLEKRACGIDVGEGDMVIHAPEVRGEEDDG